MTDPGSDARQLADLLVEPNETLNVELKSWLDISGNNDQRALLAKAIIALANHGGGFILIGFERTETGSAPNNDHRPKSLAEFNTDTINSIVSRFCDPKFHCDISIHKGPDGLEYPIVTVPGGHHVPIRSTKDSPDGKTIRKNAYYIRRPGPASEVPQDAREWDTLIRRVVTNAREELLNQFRMILLGGAELPIEPSQMGQAEEWLETSLRRWESLIATLPDAHPARMEAGHFAVAYSLFGGFERPSLRKLMDLLPQATIRYTGWPEFWVPTKDSIKPRPVDGVIECWIGGDNSQIRDGAHSDFWRISPDGKAFLIRGLQEDGRDYGLEPGTVFDITTPTWRLGEALMHASALATILGDDDAEVVLVAEWTGLKGRSLVAPPDSSRMMVGGHAAHQDRYRGTVRSKASEIPNALVELVSQLMFPLYEIFSFFQLPPNLPAQELSKMRGNKKW